MATTERDYDALVQVFVTVKVRGGKPVQLVMEPIDSEFLVMLHDPATGQRWEPEDDPADGRENAPECYEPFQSLCTYTGDLALLADLVALATNQQ